MRYLYIAVAVIVVCFCAAIINDRRQAAKKQAAKKQAAEEKRQAQQEKLENLRREKEEEKAQAAAQREEWEALHGRFKTSLAGVTFENEDGTSRQKLLKDFKARGGQADLELEEYEYKGAPAIRVLVDGECVGNIPRNRVDELQAIMDRLERANLEVEAFRPDDDDEPGQKRGALIYRADLYLIYSK